VAEACDDGSQLVLTGGRRRPLAGTLLPGLVLALFGCCGGPSRQHEYLMRIGIIGLGLMGGSLALALREQTPGLTVLGEDTDEATQRTALESGLIVEGRPREADLLVLACPISAMRAVFGGLRGFDGVVTDVASTKVQVLAWAGEAGLDLVGGHPMCGREQFGLSAAQADLYQGAPWVLTRDEPMVLDLVRSVGANPVFLTAERHDRVVAGISHAAFLLSAAYVLALAGSPDWEDMQRVAGPGFRDVSRLAAGDPRLYAAIATSNRTPVAETLRAIEQSLAALRQRVEAGGAELPQLFSEAKRLRDRWAGDHPEGGR